MTWLKPENLRTQLAALRTHTGLLMAAFPELHFPIAHRAIAQYSSEVDHMVTLFPDDSAGLWTSANLLKNAWHLTVRPSIYPLELALSISPGVLPAGGPCLVSWQGQIPQRCHHRSERVLPKRRLQCL